MRLRFAFIVGMVAVCLMGGSLVASAGDAVQLGPRPFYLVDNMDDGPLKDSLKMCADGPFKKTDFSIGHRGAPMQFPEHTRESYEAAARMGAGVLECDVAFTKDRQLVCRHSQCDLATTTDILAIPELAAKCSKPFRPARIDAATGKVLEPATAMCCTSDLTVEEFKRLKGKMDASDPAATTVEAFMKGTPAWRTDLYTATGTVLTHAESIELFKKLGVKMTPELKTPSVDMPYQGDYTQEKYAQQMIDEYKAAGVDASMVYAQSFKLDDILYWLRNEPEFGRQAVFLDEDGLEGFDNNKPETWSPTIDELKAEGVKIVAPPLWFLVTVENGKIRPSEYARQAKAAGLGIITWSLERSGLLADGGGWYYQSIKDVIRKPGDMMTLVDVLAQQVGVIGIFSDWPATVTYYANCKGL
ncbi:MULTISPECIES: glycerophosphodiester phosphodiesterase family protein [unclassified Pseudodesulfovibrio]|uniref:glycerophosphodiester phosphodiesterase family protein n=1 Tax=unclassified Pseudodesulfovibrio TaxID=2661612 RepID=UPI000FEB9C76|nr:MULTISPECIES: glycerophosphodiester phosphodiesterase family protein [unclassified Pseudodesulfovibrio]MCJ2164434.1 glycerophosphodiester phosphodiesterase [Pseudodesulfovibrio sp. S3-i]RWU04638.1 glycerophosphodiester phosphodiesterase [Pseudodesulfovibrio sp. S3]